MLEAIYDNCPGEHVRNICTIVILTPWSLPVFGFDSLAEKATDISDAFPTEPDPPEKFCLPPGRTRSTVILITRPCRP